MRRFLPAKRPVAAAALRRASPPGAVGDSPWPGEVGRGRLEASNWELQAGHSLVLLCMLGATLICGACHQPVTRLNAPPHGASDEVSGLQSQYTHMTDNALLTDMTISDVHFVPHRSTLNSLGRERLARLAALMQVHGGTIRFDSELADPKLVAERTQQILAFLAEAGIDVTAEVLVPAARGGRGMDAGQAILIKAHEATYQPKRKEGGGAE